MSETGTKACDIKATIGSEFTVTLPKTITLDPKTKAADYTVSCEGDLAGAESVTVTPDVSFAMTQNDKADVTATVTQTKTTFRSSTYETALTDQEVKIGGETITGNITAPSLTAGTWDGTMNFNVSLNTGNSDSSTDIPTSPSEEAVTLSVGDTYTLGGYSWTAADVDNVSHTAVLQSQGVTGGYWPGYQMEKFGNGSNYTSDIDGQDISDYDDKTQTLYSAIKSAENVSADYGSGLFLVSNEKVGTTEDASVGSGNYFDAIKIAANNRSSFNAGNTSSWLGTHDGNGAWGVNLLGGVEINNYQTSSCVVAPAFNIDLTKVTLEEHALTVK